MLRIRIRSFWVIPDPDPIKNGFGSLAHKQTPVKGQHTDGISKYVGSGSEFSKPDPEEIGPDPQHGREGIQLIKQKIIVLI